MNKSSLIALLFTLAPLSSIAAQTLEHDIERDYEAHLASLFDHFHRNPELSLMEIKNRGEDGDRAA